MGFNEFMSKIRYWDNQSAKWMMRHFYLIFFEFVIVIIFSYAFYNTIQFIDFAFDIRRDDITQRLLLTQTIYQLVIVLLMLLNSFWMLYIFNSIIRLRSILKDISFNLNRTRRRFRHPPQQQKDS